MFSDFSWVADPTAWGGLGTLVLLEIVLGVDNLVFISILSSRLPPAERKQAFTIGLSLALVMRLVLLSTIAWIIGLTEPWFTLWGKAFSARDVILVVGGFFLLLKGTMELHERLEGPRPNEAKEENHAVFWQVITQIVVLDAIFSLDSVITSVGMVKELSVMMLAVIAAMLVMLLASRPLTQFVERHPTVIILCLGFLLMIGLSLILDGLGFHIPKGYLYAAIGFSIFVEGFNQLALRNRRNRITTRGLRESAARAVLELLGGGLPEHGNADLDMAALSRSDHRNKVFGPEERAIVARVIRFGGRTARYIMTPRHRIQCLNKNDSPENMLAVADAATHSYLPLICGETDEVLGVVDLRRLLLRYRETGKLDPEQAVIQAPMVFEHTSLPDLLDEFRQCPAPVAVILDEYGTAVGIVTPLDILSAIAGHMGEAAFDPDSLRRSDNSWILPGRLALDEVFHSLDITPDEELSSATPAGLLLERFGHIPVVGESLDCFGYRWEVVQMDGLRIEQIRVARLPLESEEHAFPEDIAVQGCASL